jgi:hypothetical protein
MGRLQAWYPSVLVILLFWAVAIGTARLSRRWQQLAIAFLLGFSVAAWFTQSELWPGPKFELSRYQVSDYERQISDLLDELPADAIVMAQDPLVPHLSHRQDIYVFPWVRNNNISDYIVLERGMRPYPLQRDQYRTYFYNVLAGTDYEVDQQLEDLFIFKYAGDVAPDFPYDEQWAEAIKLNGYDVDFGLPGEAYQPDLKELPAGTTLRVALYWEVLAPMEQNYTVFVHAVSGEDEVIGQHDSWPADTHRPTSVLPEGEKVRDVHFVRLDKPASADELMLRIGLYESVSGEPLENSQGNSFIMLPMTRSGS